MFGLAAWLLVTLCLLGASGTLHAQEVTLVSNIDQSRGSTDATTSEVQWQGFTAGSAATLTSIEISLNSLFATGAGLPSMTLHTSRTTAAIATLTTTETSVTSTPTKIAYSLPAGTPVNLTANATYYVKMEGGGAFVLYTTTELDGEDSGGQSGWTIANGRYRAAQTRQETNSLLIRVKGTVTSTNNPPTVANEIPDQTATEGQAFSFQFNTNTFADMDTGDTLTYTATLSDDTDLPGWLTFTDGTRTFSGTPADGDVETHMVKVTASDGTATISDTFNIAVAANCAAPTFGMTRRHIWTGEVTVGKRELTNLVTLEPYILAGYEDSTPPLGSLDESTFSIGSRETTIKKLYITSNNRDIFLDLATFLTLQQARGLHLHVCDAEIDVTATAIGIALMDDPTSNAFRTFSFSDAPLNWTKVSTRDVYLSIPDNNAATGAPEITGTAQVGETLTAGVGDIADTDGLPTTTFPMGYEFQWVRVDGTNMTDISGATSQTYTLTDDDLGKTVKVKVSFKDQRYVASYTRNNVMVTNAPLETRESTATDTVVETPMQVTCNSSDTNEVWCTTVTVASLTASTSGHGYLGTGHPLTDSGGTLGEDEFVIDGTTYTVWRVTVATHSTNHDYFTVAKDTPAQTTRLPDESELSLELTPSGGTTVTYLLSNATFNDSTTIADRQGYRWDTKFSGNPWATGSTGTVKLIRSSTPNTAPTITGTARVGETLTANQGGIADPDGLPAGPFPTGYTFQWVRTTSGVDMDISGATSHTYVLVDADAGNTVKVTVGFTDGGGNSETRTSAATPTVNTPATGTPAITGTVQAGRTLTAGPGTGASAIADADGLPAGPFPAGYTFQWVRFDADGISNRTPISGATSRTYIPGAADVGKTLKVEVSFADGLDYIETRTSEATAAVTAAPPNAPTISGTLRVGATLTAAQGTIEDTDGLPTGPFPTDYTFQWVRVVNGTDGDITGATSQSYKLVDADAGHTIKVKVGFTDGASNAETRTSEAVGPVAANAAPEVANMIDNQTATEGMAFSFQFDTNTFADTDADDTLAYTATLSDDNDLPDWLTFTPSTRTFSGTPVDGDVGTHSVKVTASDGVLSVSDEFDIVVAANCPAPDLGTRRKVWEATLTVERTDADPNNPGVFTYGLTDSTKNIEQLTDHTFTIGSLAVPVIAVGVVKGGSDDGNLLFTIYDVDLNDLSYAQAVGLDLHVCDVAVDLLAETDMPDSGYGSFVVATTLDWSTVATRKLILSLPANNAATGAPAIEGIAEVGRALTAKVGTMADDDGLPATFPDDYTFQWVRVDGTTKTDISGATASTYTLHDDDLGKRVEVKVSFKDELHVEGDALETRTSAVYPAMGGVGARTNAPTIAGTAKVGETLTANQGTIEDSDGLPTGPFPTDYTFQWVRVVDGTDTDITGATSQTYVLADADGGNTVKVTVSFTDGASNSETRTSAQTGTVEAIKPATPTKPTLVSMSETNKTLTVEWTHPSTGGSALIRNYVHYREPGATSWRNWFTGSNAPVTQTTIRGLEPDTAYEVRVHVTNAVGASDWSPTSDPFTTRASNRAATGVAVTGTAKVGEVLTADISSLADADGKTLADANRSGYGYTYQWVRVDPNNTSNETDIPDATSTTYTLTNDDEDKKVKVRVSFRDDADNDEAPESALSDAVVRAPELVSARYQGTELVLTYHEPLDESSEPAPSAYTVTLSTGTAPTVTAVSIDGDKVTLTLSAEPASSATVKLTYAVPSTNPVQDVGGTDAAAFTDQEVDKDVEVRLVDGTVAHEGRIEMRYNGEWRSVCDDYWSDNNADVACRMAGHKWGSVDNSGRFLGSIFNKKADGTPKDNGKFWLDDVRCLGDEESLLDCPRRNKRAIGTHNCRAGEAAGVRCRSGAYGVPVIDKVVINNAPADVANSMAAEPGADGYSAGETLEVTLQWSEDVVVTTPTGKQVPEVAVDFSGARFATAQYASGTGSKNLVFTYTLPPGASSNATAKVYKHTHLVRGFQLRGSTITSEANPATHAELVHGGYPADAGKVPPPHVRRAMVALMAAEEKARRSSVSGLGVRALDVQPLDAQPLNVKQRSTQQTTVQPLDVQPLNTQQTTVQPRTIEVRLEFDRVVVVDTMGGTPSVAVVLADGQQRRARYVEGSGTAQLVFRYTLVAGERAAEPVRVVANSLELGGGTIRGEFGRDARLVHAGSAGAAPAEVVGAPVIGDAGTDGQWGPGESVDVTVAFDRSVEVQGTPTIGVVLGGERREAECALCGGHEELVFAYRLVEGDGAHTEVAVVGDSLALNGGRIHSAGVDAVLAHAGAAKAAGPALPLAPEAATARFEGLPAHNDGTTAFSVELHFSAEPDALSYETVAGGLLVVSGGTVTGARRLDAPSNRGWEVDIEPTRGGDIGIVLPARGCAEAGAVCFGGETLSHAVAVTVPGMPFTAAFTRVPAEHDAETGFEVGFELSEAPRRIGYEMVRRSLFVVRGGRIEGARRLAPPSNRRWVLAVAPTGAGEVSLRVRGTRDCAGLPNVCTSDGRKLGAGLRVAVPGPAAFSVADAEVDENAQSPALGFVVTLSRARGAESSVDYATSDDTATAGSDYTAASGTLVFAAGETEKAVEVAVLGDAHDEGEETVTFTLSNATPTAYVRIDDAEATGTIVNDDAMPRAWLARFGRTVGTQVLDALGGRLDGAGGAGGSHVTVGGIPLAGAGRESEEEESERTDPFALPEWATRAREAEARTLTMEELVLGSAFTLSAGADDDTGPAYTAWGRVARGGFSAELDEPGRERLSLDGKVTTGFVGVDAEWERLLAGVLLSRSRGEGTYRSTAGIGAGGGGEGTPQSTPGTDSGGSGDGGGEGTSQSTPGTDSSGSGSGGEGTVESALTGVYPYARLELSPRVSAWAVAGAGTGELTLRPPGSEVLETGMSLTLGALGLEGQVLDGTGASGVSLDVRSDALWVRTRSDAIADGTAGNLAEADGDVTRLRLLLRTERAFSFEGGATFTPSGEVGLRHDGGDAETGTGVELGLGLRYGAGALTAQGRFRALVAHEASGYEEWGASASVRYGAGASGRGLTLELAPEWGRTGSAAEQLWSARAAGDLVTGDTFEAPGRLRADLGYGFGLGGGLGDGLWGGLGGRDSVLTPYTGLALGDGGSRQWRFGVRWQLGAHATAGLEATRDTGAGGAEPADALALRVAVRF